MELYVCIEFFRMVEVKFNANLLLPEFAAISFMNEEAFV